MNTRAKMRRSNQKAIAYLLKEGFDAVWLQPHLRWDTVTYFSECKYKSKDMFGVGDGVAIKNGILYLLQIKTNTKHKMKEFFKFCDDFKISGLFITVYDRQGAEMHTRCNTPRSRKK